MEVLGSDCRNPALETCQREMQGYAGKRVIADEGVAHSVLGELLQRFEDILCLWENCILQNGCVTDPGVERRHALYRRIQPLEEFIRDCS